MALSELGISFDPQKTAEQVHKDVSARYSNITPEDADRVVQDLAEGAKVTKFIGVLAYRRLRDIATGKTPPLASSPT
ncbi:MAG: hypothetical protein HY427_01320 [Candidatus Levybacteria bacterium]|nr:hypothetical protein [Candidatus Levybacteria bacterium]